MLRAISKLGRNPFLFAVLMYLIQKRSSIPAPIRLSSASDKCASEVSNVSSLPPLKFSAGSRCSVCISGVSVDPSGGQ